MSLRKYHQKRDFKTTREPRGKVKKTPSKKLLYIIQKHAASHLHYDFRIELHGVLKSWAVPKGPCLDPKVKRLAMHVEDHPMEYGHFEGIIPKGEYGGGTVMLWDEGTWEPLDDNPFAAYKKGDLKFRLKGKKLKGIWKLIRIKTNEKSWLLMKVADEYAKPLKEYDITLAKNKSVKTKQSIDEIAEKYQHIWGENGQIDRPKEKPTKKIKEDTPTIENFKLTNPTKILYKEAKITKFDVAEYYYVNKDWILPYIKNRPLSVLRCPEGYQECFFQKHVNKMTPKAISSISIREKAGRGNYIYIKDEMGLMALTQMGVLEIHPWGSKVDDVEHPDFIVIDLDPAPDVPWKKVVMAALDVRDQLKNYKLTSFVKTTGGKGLHVVIPILPEYDWEEVKNFSKAFVEYMAMEKPKEYVTVMTKAKRKGKIFVDYLRNARGATAVAPYSTRARKDAPISVPLAWDELTYNYKDTFYTIKTIQQRLDSLKKDPWRDFLHKKQSLRLEELEKVEE